MICERCGRRLVEVDNPFRREVRHRRGEECSGTGPTIEELAERAGITNETFIRRSPGWRDSTPITYASVLAAYERLGDHFAHIPVRYEMGPEVLDHLRAVNAPDAPIGRFHVGGFAPPVFVLYVLAPLAWQAVNGRGDVIAGGP